MRIYIELDELLDNGKIDFDNDDVIVNAIVKEILNKNDFEFCKKNLMFHHIVTMAIRKEVKEGNVDIIKALLRG